MSHLNDEPPELDDQEETETTNSSLSMLVTMLLLISGFILAGTMMFHYGSKHAGKDGIHDVVKFDFASLLDQGKAYSKKIQVTRSSPESDKVGESQLNSSKPKSLFGNREGKVNWPKLKLTGFGKATEGHGGFAIINGDQFHIDQRIDDKVRVKEIRAQDVIVEYRGETKILTVELLQH